MAHRALILLLSLALGCRTAVEPGAPSPPGAPPPPDAARGGLRFEDFTAASGLAFTHEPFRRGDKSLPEIMGAGAALLDYDRDGNLDAFLVQGNRLDGDPDPAVTSRLFRGHGDGTFEDVTMATGAGVAGYGMGVAAGDADGDGFVDLYVTAVGPNHLLRNVAGQRFEDVTAAAGVAAEGWSASAAFLDIDEDGDLDLYVSRYVDWSLANNPRCSPRDGLLVYCHPDEFMGLTDLLYRNDGEGRFAEIAGPAGVGVPGGPWDSKSLGVEVGDIDGDGHADVYVANDSTRNFLFLGDGRGLFRDVSERSGTAYNQLGQTQAGMGLDSADVDGDGDVDLFVTNLDQETNTLYLNQGGGLFRDATYEAGLAADSLPLVGFGAGFLDADRDGDMDLLITNGHVVDNVALYRPERSWAQPFLLYENDGRGRFRNVTAEAGPALNRPAVGRAMAVGDIDNDGDPDALVTTNGGPPIVLLNRTEPRGRWLGVALRSGSSPDGLGATLRLVTGSRTLLRQATTSGGYLAACDARVLFGVGSDPGPYRLEIAWPSGRHATLTDPPLDRYIEIVEGHETDRGEPGR